MITMENNVIKHAKKEQNIYAQQEDGKKGYNAN